MLVFNGGIDSVFVIDYHNKTYQLLNANLNSDNTLKATYLDGEKLVMASNGLYLGDLSQGYDLSSSPTLLPDYLSDLDNLDLIKGGDTIYFCEGDSTYLLSRYQSLFVLWYRDGISTNNTKPTLTAQVPGDYRLLVQMDSSAGTYILSLSVDVTGCSATVYDTIMVLPAVNVDGQLSGNSLVLRIAPNPANEIARISLDVLESSYIHVEIRDVLGNRVALMQDGFLEAGKLDLTIDSNTLSDGLYFLKVATGNAQKVRILTVNH